MIIKPYDTIAAEAFNADDFPAIKHFWACKQGAVAVGGKITDIIAGADLTIPGGAAVSGNGLVVANANYAATAALTAPGTESCLLLACATWGGTTSGIVYGSISATGGISTGNVSAGAKLFDGTTTKTCTVNDDGVTASTHTAGTYTRATMLSSVAGVPTQLMGTETNLSALDVYTNISDLTAATAITDVADVSQNINVTTAGITLYGLAFFKFAGALPPKEVIQAAAAWCHYHWINDSDVTMYPGFKGLA